MDNEEEQEVIPSTEESTEEGTEQEKEEYTSPSYAQPAASSEDKADDYTPAATESALPKPGLYTKAGILNTGNFNFLDREIIECFVDDNARLTVDDAREVIKKYKEGELN